MATLLLTTRRQIGSPRVLSKAWEAASRAAVR